MDPTVIADRLAPAIDWPGAEHFAKRTWRQVAAAPQFDAWLIAWPSGGRLEFHDHGRSAGSIAVVRGALTETVPWRNDAGRLGIATRTLEAGPAVWLPPGHVHDVTNDATEVAISLHVYSPALTQMTRYAIVDNELVAKIEGTADPDDVDDEAERLRLHEIALVRSVIR
jgi:predicted metal-dependent enzyme (double-stranded beta helix superfamily)